ADEGAGGGAQAGGHRPAGGGEEEGGPLPPRVVAEDPVANDRGPLARRPELVGAPPAERVTMEGGLPEGCRDDPLRLRLGAKQPWAVRSQQAQAELAGENDRDAFLPTPRRPGDEHEPSGERPWSPRGGLPRAVGQVDERRVEQIGAEQVSDDALVDENGRCQEWLRHRGGHP